LAELASLHSRDKGGLLPAQDLDRITHWQAGTSPEWAQRYVKKETWEVVLAFIEASRAAVQREAQRRTRQRLQKRVLLMTLSIVLVATTLVLAVFSYRAETAKAAAQQALTNSYVRTIGVSSISSEELTALWELAELDPAKCQGQGAGDRPVVQERGIGAAGARSGRQRAAGRDRDEPGIASVHRASRRGTRRPLNSTLSLRRWV